MKLYVYPMRQEAFDRYLATGQAATTPGSPAGHAFAASVMINAKNVQVSDNLLQPLRPSPWKTITSTACSASTRRS